MAETQLYQALFRAREVGLPATLTADEWAHTVADWSGGCAYCQSGPAALIEHFVPIDAGGGTTAGNCLPCCDLCNRKKSTKVGADLDRVFGEEHVAELRVYLVSRSTGPDVGTPPAGHRTGTKARSGPSGPSIPEAQRHTRRYVLRLPEAPAAALDALCEQLGLGPSAAVSTLLLAQTHGLVIAKKKAPG